MILYWYMHWFWITITVNIIYCACDDVVATTAALQTSGSENGKAVTENPATQPARNYTQQDLSVIQPNNSLQQNFTYLNVTDVGFEVGNSSNETVIVTSERIGIELTETTGTLTGAGITGITLGCVTLVGLILLISFLLYRNRGLNRPQVLSDRSSNLDSSGYIDDNSVRDNSEEMYSLDNDSFLNSLEAMTIQNYWTDTVKHTKFETRSD
ncbi:PREDICTED: uncharacterized protein LOC108568727 isoform X2 [Nicrophorus vespilloides]|uniref:Uncharacterized protein LOC108568727 isoform X2 n=1 Tax=Nicrophorus vespilloides TaxID=110193 RepID=A0ABM1NF56_NICVS|nr:PREDICTED: uncharacterized protein LOC108568727 isoform X2 [Nicrophorus vespilloides]